VQRIDRRTMSSSPSRTTTECLLPPPIHVGKYLREKRLDFRLPYDVWWLHSSGAVGIVIKYIRMCTPLHQWTAFDADTWWDEGINFVFSGLMKLNVSELHFSNYIFRIAFW